MKRFGCSRLIGTARFAKSDSAEFLVSSLAPYSVHHPTEGEFPSVAIGTPHEPAIRGERPICGIADRFEGFKSRTGILDPVRSGRFIGTTAQSDSSRACVSALWLIAFADRSRSWLVRDVLEVSRFSCMLFLCVRGFFDYAGSTGHSRFIAVRRVAFPKSGPSQHPVSRFFEAQ
jgi:hypothetical protein